MALVVLLVAPLGAASGAREDVAFPDGAVVHEIAFESEEAMEAWLADFQARMLASMEVPDDYTIEEATDVLSMLYAGEDVDPLRVIHTAKFMRTVDGTTAAGAGAKALERLIVAALAEESAADENPNQSSFDTVGKVATGGKVAAATLVPETAPVLMPHDVRLIALYVALAIDVYSPYCGIWNCLIYTTFDIDALAAAAFDHAGLTDTIAAQYPVSYTVYFGWSCWWDWGWKCRFVFGSFENDKILGTGVQYTFAYPALSGEFATRATGSDAIQNAYDRLGNLYSQTPREWTSASHTPNVPANPAGVGNRVGLPGPVATPPVSVGPYAIPSTDVGGGALDTRMGVGDVGTASPPVNYYGVQRSTSIPACVAVACVPAPYPGPATPSEVPNPATFWNGVRISDHGDYGVVAADSTGQTGVYTASVLRTFQLNLLAVRWHNAGAATVDQGGAASTPSTGAYQVPAEFVFKTTGSYFRGGSVHVDAYYQLDDPIRVL